MGKTFSESFEEKKRSDKSSTRGELLQVAILKRALESNRCLYKKKKQQGRLLRNRRVACPKIEEALVQKSKGDALKLTNAQIKPSFDNCSICKSKDRSGPGIRRDC